MTSVNNICKCVFYTIAYNAEKTIARAIESILAQTEKRWIYYVLDNGATDRTGEIIKKYAQKDSRIISLRNSKNHVYEKGNGVEILQNYDDSVCFCWLDADDEYKPGFLEKMMKFMSDHSLDLAVCGHDFINATSGKFTGTRILAGNLILDTPENFCLFFPVYHQFTRTLWCKLYKISTLRNINPPCPEDMYYGTDTVLVQEVFRLASKIGILAESLHKCYVSTKSSTYQFEPRRIECDRFLFDFVCQFLIEKCGKISPQNDEFLKKVYFNAIFDTTLVLLNSRNSTVEKLEGLREIFDHEQTKKLFAWSGYADKKAQLLVEIMRPVESISDYRKLEIAKRTVEVICAMYPDMLGVDNPEILSSLVAKLPAAVVPLAIKDYNRVLKLLKKWASKDKTDIVEFIELEVLANHALGKSDDEIFTLLVNIKKKRFETEIKLDIDSQVNRLLCKYPLLANTRASLAFVFADVVSEVMKANTFKALELLIAASEKAEILQSDMEAFLLLGQNLSAVCEQKEIFVHFKKVWISFLLDRKRFVEAKKELGEWSALLPDDADINGLQCRYDEEQLLLTKGASLEPIIRGV